MLSNNDWDFYFSSTTESVFCSPKKVVFSFDITLIYYFIIAAHKINDLSFFPASTSKSQSIKIKNRFSDAIIRTQCGSSIQIVSNKKNASLRFIGRFSYFLIQIRAGFCFETCMTSSIHDVARSSLGSVAFRCQ